MDIQSFARLVDELVASIPPLLLLDLHGGIAISPGARRDEGDPEGVFVLGEYVTDAELGDQIVLHYGSFSTLFDDDTMRHELWNAIRHELRHHWANHMRTQDLEPEDIETLRHFLISEY